MTRAAEWLPPALRAAPGGVDGDARLLDALLDAVERQRGLLEADIDQVWQDLFVDSCADWALPYLGALIGLPADAERLEIAFAVALRRRKGTPAALEDFAEVVTGLTARVVEGWQVSLWAQRLGHPPPPRVAAVDLRERARLRVGSPFERARRSVTPGGPWHPRAATTVVWPWQVRTLVEVEAAPLGERRFALHPLGAEAPLYLRPRPLRLGSEAAPAGSRTGDEADAPVRATYRVMEALAAPGEVTYGDTLALADTHPLADRGSGTPPLLRMRVGDNPVAWGNLRFGSLVPGQAPPSPPGSGQVLVDPARGHVLLGDGLNGTVTATWHRPLPGVLGALSSTAAADPSARAVVTVDPDGSGPTVRRTIDAAITLARTLAGQLDPADSQPGRPDVEIRLASSTRLAAPSPLTFAPPVPRWRLVAPWPVTPTVVGDLEFDLPGACVELAGFLLTGDLKFGPRLAGVTLDGLTMDPSAPGTAQPGAQLLVAEDAWELAVSATRCVLGPVRAELAAAPLTLTDCVVDGRGLRLRPCGGDPGGAPTDAVAPRNRFGPALRADGVTFAGAVRADAVDGKDCIFGGGIAVVQRQAGCLRHCCLGPDLTSPPAHPVTYACGPFPAPAFVTEGFDGAGYYALELEPDHPLLAAAGDGGEVGAHHRARRGERVRRLRRRVEEFTPLGLRARVALADWEER